MAHIPKILFVGYGRSGKDTAGQFLHGRGCLQYGGSTSWAALPMMASFLKVHPMYAWETRHKHRATWKEHCDWLRSRGDQCFLMRRALETGNMITGTRGLLEIEAAIAENLFDSIVWIENPRVEKDFTVDFGQEKATDVIFNDGSLLLFYDLLLRWATRKGYIS